jgi:hypothetical protein
MPVSSGCDDGGRFGMDSGNENEIELVYQHLLFSGKLIYAKVYA